MSPESPVRYQYGTVLMIFFISFQSQKYTPVLIYIRTYVSKYQKNFILPNLVKIVTPNGEGSQFKNGVFIPTNKMMMINRWTLTVFVM